ncbi:SusC/RagA family TonB-linked outer membrane protein [Sphingobacterium psychroaquaticum]|uniref:TonB-linked outer membrane protein, SusC/RagA family n=1 Tax=Sphingobacterium psychroaquaticum TaxID=561061 RepID=A0A1X7KFS8_9SPHI|nr:TonB-dependent receptor [Sphingobacterium psychroaquaticum]SMG39819.1 TonB-linked outer membrane protein, SusC/RagA family [Sphingobacterium psychroaquaticum]
MKKNPHAGSHVPILYCLKWILMVKFTLLLIVAFCYNSYAITSLAQGNVTLKNKNIKFKNLIQLIEKQTDLRFIYSDKQVDKVVIEEINAYNKPWKQLLAPILATTGFRMQQIQGGRVILSQIDNQELTSTGKVVNSKGEPLPGVSIKEKGSDKGTLTNDNGEFSLPVKNQQSMIQISSIGFITQEIPFSTTAVQIQLKEDLAHLEEVVVVGYGAQKRINLTGAVSTINGKELENRPVVNATQSLQGVVPGLNVNVGGNTKPGQSFNLNVRGMGNLSGTDGPYVLVDGMEMSLADVNASDIENISVLKDASASAIYGSRAAYGVILVTTKKGAAGKKTINVSSNTGLTSPVKLPEMVNSVDFANFFNAATFNALGTKQYSEDKIALLQQYINDPTSVSIFPEVNTNNYASWENSANGVANTNWFDLHYKPTALRQNYNVSMSGGNAGTQFYVSGGFYDEDGILRYADINYKRYNFNSSIQSSLTSWLKVKANVKYTRSNNQSPLAGFEGMFFHNLARMRPNVSPYDFYGNWTEQSMVPYLQSGSKDNLTDNTLALLGGLEISPLKNWKIFADLNYRLDNSANEILKLPGTIYGIDGTTYLVNRSEYNIPLGGSYERMMNNNNYLTPNIYTNYKVAAGKHNFDLTAGFQQELNTFKQLYSSSIDLISFDRPGINLSTGTKTSNEARNHWATRGVFARVNYNFNQKYLLEVNGRYDGSSRFARGNRWGFFPSISAAYNMSEESFIKNKVGWIDQLKIRGSYGSLGNQAGAGLYAYSENMSIVVPGANGSGGSYYFQNGRESYINAPGAFNPLITWEKVRSANAGLDFTFLNYRLTGTVDLYQRNTKDMLGPSKDVADLFGTTPARSNNADLRTRGWELNIKWRDKINDDWGYNLGLILNDYVSVVTKYQNPTKFNPASQWYEGRTAGEIWGYQANQLIRTKAEADVYNKLDRSFISARDWIPGDLMYLDTNEDGKINNGNNRIGDMGDLSIIGNSTPRYSYSFSGGLSWKDLSLNMLWQGIGKRDYSPGFADAYFWGAGALAQVTVFNQHLDYFSENNPDGYYPNPYAAPAGAINSYINKTQLTSTRYLQSAAYLRLKNLTINYSLPKALTQRWKFERINVFVSGENLLTFSRLAKMFDPETIEGGSGMGKIYPLSKVYSFGLNINF